MTSSTIEEHKEHCESLFDEYEALRLRTGVVRNEARVREADLRAYGIDPDDLARLVELERQLDEECKSYLTQESEEPVEEDWYQASDSRDPEENKRP